ncbi:MAG: FCD domain-containing protein [Pseudomonadota bacterium]|nr:FCD domain-containing protein [Pseudomonadota bacterium]
MIRHRLETLAVGLAAERATAAQLPELWDLFGRVGAPVRDGAADRYVDLNTRFHALVSDVSCAPRLQRLVRGCGSGRCRWRRSRCGRMRNSYAEHEAILACLEARVSAGADAAMGQHIDNAHREFIATLRMADRAEAPVLPSDEA